MSDESTPTGEIRMCAIFRADLILPPGKMAAQAGHAFLGAWLEAVRLAPDLLAPYVEGATPKLVLLAPDEVALRAIHARAHRRGVPRVLITDSARTVLPYPMVTVLGLGPMRRTDYNSLTRGLELCA